jgi:hypothetical protein
VVGLKAYIRELEEKAETQSEISSPALVANATSGKGNENVRSEMSLSDKPLIVDDNDKENYSKDKKRKTYHSGN